MIKISKKELRTPDQILQVSRSLFTWFRSSGGVLVGFLVAGLVAVIGILFWIQMLDKTEAKAQYRYGLARGYFENWSIAKDGKQKPEDLAKTKSDLDGELEKLQKEYSTSKANGLADGIRGQLASYEKKWDEAVRYFEKFEAALPGGERDLGRLPLANAYENAGKNESALNLYSKLAESKNDFFVGVGLLGKARIQRAMMKDDEARKTYERYLEKFGTSADAAFVRGLLAQLSAETKVK